MKSGKDVYARESMDTASPERLVVMLYDGVVRDLQRAEASMHAGEYASAGERLLNGQAILLELLASLDTTAWEGGPGLASLYTYLVRELVRANIERDVAAVVSCREMLESLRDAWRVALADVQASKSVVSAA